MPPAAVSQLHSSLREQHAQNPRGARCRHGRLVRAESTMHVHSAHYLNAPVGAARPFVAGMYVSRGAPDATAARAAGLAPPRVALSGRTSLVPPYSATAALMDGVGAGAAMPPVVSAVGRCLEALHVTQRALSVTQRAISVTQRALNVTQRALSVTQRAISVTQRALSVTQRALSVTQRALSVTQRALSVTQRTSQLHPAPLTCSIRWRCSAVSSAAQSDVRSQVRAPAVSWQPRDRTCAT
jgi:hypothetical protein